MKTSMEISSSLLYYLTDDNYSIEYNVGLLRKEGFTVQIFYNDMEFLKHLSIKLPDCVLLDGSLANGNGLFMCRSLKQQKEWRYLAILYLTQSNQSNELIQAFEAGADDCISRPIHPQELVARLRAILRRQKSSNIQIGQFILQPESLSIQIGDSRIYFSWREYKILELLVLHAGEVFSRTVICQQIWKKGAPINARNVDVHIVNIRKKLGKYRSLLRTIRDKGYMIMVCDG